MASLLFPALGRTTFAGGRHRDCTFAADVGAGPFWLEAFLHQVGAPVFARLLLLGPQAGDEMAGFCSATPFLRGVCGADRGAQRGTKVALEERAQRQGKRHLLQAILRRSLMALCGVVPDEVEHAAQDGVGGPPEVSRKAEEAGPMLHEAGGPPALGQHHSRLGYELLTFGACLRQGALLAVQLAPQQETMGG